MITRREFPKSNRMKCTYILWKQLRALFLKETRFHCHKIYYTYGENMFKFLYKDRIVIEVDLFGDVCFTEYVNPNKVLVK